MNKQVFGDKLFITIVNYTFTTLVTAAVVGQAKNMLNTDNIKGEEQMTLPISASASEIEQLGIEGDSKEFYYECNACHRLFITFVAVENHLLYNHSGNDSVGYRKKRLTEL